MNKCTKHPIYKGIRKGKSVLECPTCMEIYKEVHKDGFIEKRNKQVQTLEKQIDGEQNEVCNI